jgi:uncharacterized membrane protein
VQPTVCLTHHPVLDGVPADWQALLGHNQVTAKPDAEVLVHWLAERA